MHRGMIVMGLLVAALVVGAPQARGGVASCCGCIPGIEASSAAVDALFCTMITTEEFESTLQRCNALGQTDLVCQPAIPGTTCPQALLTDLHILCPTTAPVPAAAPGTLALLATALAVAGIVALKRRHSA